MSRRSPSVAVACGCILGEGPLWQPQERRLVWVDIKRPAVHTFQPASGATSVHAMPEPVGFILPFSANEFMVGLKSGLARFELLSGAVTRLPTPGVLKLGNRINDGALDTRGRVWFGTMDDDECEATGYFWRRRADGTIDRHQGPFIVTNGPAFSPDGCWVYTVDSVGRQIWKSRLDEEGDAQPPELFLTFPDYWGYPDGAIVDCEGHLWIAHWGAGMISRFSPAAQRVECIRLPVSQVTKCAFGGADRRQLYVTSAAIGLRREDEPLAGHLFVVEVDNPGPESDQCIVGPAIN